LKKQAIELKRNIPINELPLIDLKGVFIYDSAIDDDTSLDM